MFVVIYKVRFVYYYLNLWLRILELDERVLGGGLLCFDFFFWRSGVLCVIVFWEFDWVSCLCWFDEVGFGELFINSWFLIMRLFLFY